MLCTAFRNRNGHLKIACLFQHQISLCAHLMRPPSRAKLLSVVLVKGYSQFDIQHKPSCLNNSSALTNNVLKGSNIIHEGHCGIFYATVDLNCAFLCSAKFRTQSAHKTSDHLPSFPSGYSLIST